MSRVCDMPMDVSDLDLRELIAQLWLRSKPAVWYKLNNVKPPDLTNKDIEQTIQRNRYVDYLAGRAIKTDFSDMRRVKPRQYNRDTRECAFEDAVDYIRHMARFTAYIEDLDRARDREKR